MKGWMFRVLPPCLELPFVEGSLRSSQTCNSHWCNFRTRQLHSLNNHKGIHRSIHFSEQPEGSSCSPASERTSLQSSLPPCCQSCQWPNKNRSLMRPVQSSMFQPSSLSKSYPSVVRCDPRDRKS